MRRRFDRYLMPRLKATVLAVAGVATTLSIPTLPATSARAAEPAPLAAPAVPVPLPVREGPADAAASVRQAGEAALAGATGPAEDHSAATFEPSGHDAPQASQDPSPHEAADAGTNGWPAARGPQPFEIVRSLQFLQDQAARGNAAAIRVQAMLLRRYGPTFRDADAATWQDPRNVRAAALFVLSGGPPSVLRAILSRLDPDGGPGGEDATLLEGALAYAENRTDEAERRLGSLDTRFMESDLAAQVDLAVAQLQQAGDPAAALARLRRVMLAAPGTLLEEAALRMAVMLAEEDGQHTFADRLARQYFDRFAASVYAGNFRARFAAIYAGRPAGSETQTIDTIADVTHAIADDQQLSIFLAVSRRALVEGNLPLAASAAARALTYPGAPGADRQRALLYETAATLADRDAIEARATLEAIDPGQLHTSDVKLRDAAFDVLDEIRRPLVAEAAVNAASGGQAPAAAPDAASVSATLERGRALLRSIKDDLNEDQP